MSVYEVAQPLNDPLSVIRSAAGSAKTAEITARAELERRTILLEVAPSVSHLLEPLRHEHAEKARIARRWKRVAEIMEAAALLGDLDDE